MASGDISIDTRDILPLLEGLKKVDRELRSNANRRLREAAGQCAAGLVSELRAAAASSPTPQAALVAQTLKVGSDRIPLVRVGGARRVGHRKTPAGVLVWGSERGGANFVAPVSSAGHWIAPTVQRFSSSSAVRNYQAACASILRDAGVI